MNKAQLIDWIQKSGEVGETKAAAERALNAVLKGIGYGLKKDKTVSLVSFGSFNAANPDLATFSSNTSKNCSCVSPCFAAR